MTKPVLSAVIHHLRSLVENSGEARLSDRQLLERYLNCRDEAAFAVLVRRHGNLVLSACRRVLTEEADVEDAFQATFLVLLRKAPSVRWQTSIGNWLFGVAHRIAVRARADALRRRQESAARSVREEREAPPDLSWREALGFLHEELDRLPDKYRLPLLLCYLDGKTREEAAQALHCSAGSIKGRLERGREMLRTRLIRRGVTLSAALLAALVDAPAARSVAPALVQATLNAMRTGIYRSSVAALMKAAAPALWIGKTRLTVGVLLMVSLLAVGGSRVAPPSAAPEPPAVPKEAKTKESVVIRGRVLDPDGKPVKGARLFSPHFRKDDSTVVQRDVTDAEGRFRFELPSADARPGQNRSLIAAANGYGVQWVDLPEESSSAELKLRLVKDQAIQGRILSTEGKPVAGVRVQVVSLKTRADDRVDDFLRVWQRQWGGAFVYTPKLLIQPLDAILPSVATDKEGRFRIAGIGAERIAELTIQGAGIARTSLYVVGRPGFDPAQVNKTALDNARVDIGNARPPLLYGPTFDYVEESGRAIEGTIRTADSGDPLSGFTAFYLFASRNSLRSVSDKQGDFRLDNVPKNKQHLLEIEPPANSSWLRMNAWADDSGLLQPLKVEIRARRGVFVSGRAIDRTTGKGVWSYVRFVPLPGNKFIGKPGAYSYRCAIFTDVEGRFRMPILPGPGVLMADVRVREKTKNGQKIMPYKRAEFDEADRSRVQTSDFGDGTSNFATADNSVELLNGQNAVKYIDLAPDAANAACDLFVDRGKTMTIPIQDEQGKPLTGAVVSGVTEAWSIGGSVFTLADTESTCTVYALEPRRPRRLIFIHPQRRLACTLRVRGDEKEPPAARLVRTGTVIGRVLNLDGRPIADADITLSSGNLTARLLFAKLEALAPPIRTGADGRFRVEGVVPDLGFGLHIRRGGKYLVDPRIGNMSLEPSEVRNLGDLRVKPSP
ncbi:MAG TPA: sigma-70 family RNA polymerase sigma factor [Gemmataceae bacterium]|nr:sigma-70 family RNA polymerase sigma factor [Gemmataceae bacterium]